MRRTFMIILSAFIWAAVHFIIISSGVSIVTARGIVQNAGYPISDTPIFEQFTVNLILFALLFAIAGILFYTLRFLDVKDILLWVTVSPIIWSLAWIVVMVYDGFIDELFVFWLMILLAGGCELALLYISTRNRSLVNPFVWFGIHALAVIIASALTLLSSLINLGDVTAIVPGLAYALLVEWHFWRLTLIRKSELA